MMETQELQHGRQRRPWWRACLIGVAVALMALIAVQLDPSKPAQAADDSEEMTFLAIINVDRQNNGLDPLAISPTLTRVAQWMSQSMTSQNYFGHTDWLGRDPFQRMADFGYYFNTWKGENLAAGRAGAQAVFDQWRDSPSHRANMLNPNYQFIGIARAQGGYYGWYWATEFGGYDDR